MHKLEYLWLQCEAAAAMRRLILDSLVNHSDQFLKWDPTKLHAVVHETSEESSQKRFRIERGE